MFGVARNSDDRHVLQVVACALGHTTANSRHRAAEVVLYEALIHDRDEGMGRIIVFGEGASGEHLRLHRVEESCTDRWRFHVEVLVRRRSVALHCHVDAVVRIGQLLIVGSPNCLHAGQRGHGLQNLPVQRGNLFLGVSREPGIDVET